MSKYTILRTSAILIGLSLLAATSYPVLAQNQPPRLPVAPPARQNVPNIASKAAVLKLKLQSFKDTKKAQTAERVNTNLNNINQNQTAQMQKYLDAMSTILDKLEARINNPTPDIKNPAAAKTAIASARATIATVSAAVSAQAQKDYTIQVTSEGRIGIDAKTQRDKLHTDILAIRKAVIDAKQSVANAIRVAKSGPVPDGTGLKKEGTISGQQ